MGADAMRLRTRIARMREAATGMISASYVGVPSFVDVPLGPLTHKIPPSHHSPTLSALASVVTAHPISHEALSHWLSFINEHFTPKDNDCIDFPCNATAFFSAAVPASYKIQEMRFDLSTLEGPEDKRLREKSANKHAFIASLPRLLPAVQAVNNFEDWLHRLVQPYWVKGDMLWYPKEEYAICPLSGEPSRMFGHPYSGDVAIQQYKVLKARFGPDVKMLGLVIYLDASYQHGKKVLQVVVSLLPKPKAFRTDRARETCLLIPGIRVPKELKEQKPLNVLRRVGVALYQRGLYEGFVKKINDAVERGGTCLCCVQLLTACRLCLA